MLVVVGLVIAQDPPQMVLVPDEGAVQELAAASPDPVGLEYTIGTSPDPVGLEYTIGTVTCVFSCQREVVMRLSGTRG